MTATLRDFLIEQMDRRKLSERQFAELCGVSNTAISRAVSKTKPTQPSLQTLGKIAQATGVDIFTLVSLVMPEATDIDSEARIAAQEISRLPDTKREIVLDFIKGAIRDIQKQGG